MKRRDFITKAGLGTAAVAGAALAAPAVAQERKVLTCVSSWGRDFPGLGISAQRLMERITQLSEGRLTMEYFAGGEKVGALDVFDEVASGNSSCYISADYYYTGKHPGLAYWTAVPFGMTSPEWCAWVKFGGGQALWDEVSGEFGLKAVTCGSTGTQAGGWFNKEINSADDLKGLKMRIPGLGGQVISKLGGTTVTLPGSQIYENLVSGSIDACEWVGPYNDYFMKFYEAAKFYYTGGMHEPGGGLSFGWNASLWGSFSEWEKAVITAAAFEEQAAQYEEALAKNGEYLGKLVNEQGVETKAFPDEVWDSFGVAAAEVFEEVRDHSPLAKKIDDAFQKALREIGGTMAKFEGTFVNQRNRVLGLEA